MWVITGAIWIVVFTPIIDHLSGQRQVLITLSLGIALMINGMGFFDRWARLKRVERADVEDSKRFINHLKNSDILVAVAMGAFGVVRWRAEASDAYIWFLMAGVFIASTVWRLMISRLSGQEGRH